MTALGLRLRQHGGAGLCSVALTVAVFCQDPGRIVGDTKLDLSVDPTSFMRSSLELWHPQSAFGQLQNQAYGYLFPMGPFFAIGRALGAPDWVVQRAWQSVLLVVAFLGMRLLARRLGIGTPALQTLGALAYCLSPWLLSHLGPESAEALPTCMAPWVLAPLVGPPAFGSVRRAAAASGIALLCASGINATSTLVLLILPAIWFITTKSVRPHGRLVVWWGVAVVGATAWWALPLLELGRYSPPFLTWIESAQGTTNTTSVAQALFGTSDWLAYLGSLAGPFWTGGWTVAHNAMPVIGECVIAGLGLVGLLHRRMPYRRFLVVGLLTGVALLTIGHGGLATSPLSPVARDLLDGPLAALRNVAKFDVVIRIPLVLGLMHAGTLLVGHWRRLSYVVAAGAVAAVTVPVAAGQLEPLGSFSAIPSYWVHVASWLGTHDQDGGRALVVPAAQHPSYDWGFPTDEPLQVLATTPWADRDAPVLGGAGEARLLDAVDEVVGSGHGNPGLAPYLARAGVAWVVVRNDLDSAWEDDLIPSPAVVNAAIEGSPGLMPAARFGPVEILRVLGTSPQASTAPLAGTLRVSGAPESLMALASAGLLPPTTATVMAADPPVAGVTPDQERAVVTDGYRRREVNVGQSTYNTSGTLTATAPYSQQRAAHDYLIGSARGHQTVAVLYGLRGATASSAQSQAAAGSRISPQETAAAGFDSDPRTQWESGGHTAVGQWVQADLAGHPTLRHLTIQAGALPASGPMVDRVTVSTRSGRSELSISAEPRTYQIAGGPTTFVRITVTGVRGGGPGIKAVLKVRIDGLAPVSLGLSVPDDADRVEGPPVFVFSAQPPATGSCPTCVPIAEEADTGDDQDGMDRAFDLATGARYTLQMGGAATGALQARVADPPPAGAPLAACGQGPALTVDGTGIPTLVRGDAAEVRSGAPLAIVPCGPGGAALHLAAGHHRLQLAATAGVTPDLVVLRPTAQPVPLAAAPRRLEVGTWGAGARTVTVAPGAASWLIVRENANAGWVATLHGRTLASGVVDGWQQAFVIPAGRGGVVSLVYEPDGTFHEGLLVGALLALALLAMAVVPARRRDPSETPAPVERAALCAALGATALLVTGGLPAVGAAAAVAVLAVRARRGGKQETVDRLLQALAFVSMLAAGGLTVVLARFKGGPDVAGAGQLVCLIALAALAVSLLDRVTAPLPGEAPAPEESETAPAPHHR